MDTICPRPRRSAPTQSWRARSSASRPTIGDVSPGIPRGRLSDAQFAEPVRCDRPLEPLEREPLETLDVKQRRYEPVGLGAEQDARRGGLKSGGEGRDLTRDEELGARSARRDRVAAGDPDPQLEADAVVPLEGGIELAEALLHRNGSPDGTLGIVLVEGGTPNTAMIASPAYSATVPPKVRTSRAISSKKAWSIARRPASCFTTSSVDRTRSAKSTVTSLRSSGARVDAISSSPPPPAARAMGHPPEARWTCQDWASADGQVEGSG